MIACPWHHYEFDLNNGRELRGGRRAITYRVELVNGRSLDRIDDNDRRPSGARMLDHAPDLALG